MKLKTKNLTKIVYKISLRFYKAINTNLSGDPSEMMITWVTMAPSVKSVVEYGERCKLPLNKRAFGAPTKYQTCGWKERTIYMHRVKLEGLVPGRGYGKRFLSFLSDFVTCELDSTLAVHV